MSKIKGNNVEQIGEELAAFAKEYRRLSAYEENAIEMLTRRLYMGGMLGVEQNCLTNMVFLINRPLIKEEVRDVVDKAVKSHLKKHGKPKKLKTLPWWAMDMHTMVGKIAMSIVWKKYKEKGFKDSKELASLWFHMSSGLIPPSSANYVEVKAEPTPFESMWHLPSLRAIIPKLNGKSPKEMSEYWHGTVSKDVKGAVEWVIAKRSSGGWEEREKKERA